jgi:hypothetical protein
VVLDDLCSAAFARPGQAHRALVVGLQRRPTTCQSARFRTARPGWSLAHSGRIGDGTAPEPSLVGTRGRDHRRRGGVAVALQPVALGQAVS